MAIVDSPRLVVGGVDTHRDVNVAAVIDTNGGLLGVESFPTTPTGHRAVHAWMNGFGELDWVGVEGTGAYGAGLARHLMSQGVTVIEVDRPNRQQRRRVGKSDQIDAVEAARAVLSGRCHGRAKTGDGNAEALRTLMVVKRSARSTRIRTIVQLRHLTFTAPEELRERFRGLNAARMVDQAARLRPHAGGDPVVQSTKAAAVTLARRVQALDMELAVLDTQIEPLVKAAAPALVNLYGVGLDTAAELLIAAGDNPERIRNEAAWAMICGVAPVPVHSGMSANRYRLNHGGNRRANNALWRIVITRLGQHEPRTVAYMERRLADGKNKAEIIRCLKRAVARETFRALPR